MDQETKDRLDQERMERLRARGTAVDPRGGGNRQLHRAQHRADPQPKASNPVKHLKENGLEPHPLLQLSEGKVDEDFVETVEGQLAINEGDFLPQSTPPLTFGDSYEQEVLRHSLFQLYLRGYTRDAMGKKLQIPRKTVRAHLEKIREAVLLYMERNPEIFGAPLEALYLQVLRRRERQSSIWEELDNPDQHMESVRPQFYRLLAEEDKAIEELLGLDRKTLSIIIGTPQEQAQADLLRTMGPTRLKELLADLRETHSVLKQEEDDGGVETDESSIIIEGASIINIE